MPNFIYSSNHFTEFDRLAEYHEIATVNGTTERNRPEPRVGNDERLRDLVVTGNGDQTDNAFTPNHKRTSDGGKNTYGRQFNTTEHARTMRGVRHAINRRQRAKLEADLFATSLQGMDIETPQNGESTAWNGCDTGMSTHCPTMENELMLDDERTLEQFDPGEPNDDPLLAAILAPPPEFCSQPLDSDPTDVAGNATESSRRHVSIKPQRFHVVAKLY